MWVKVFLLWVLAVAVVIAEGSEGQQAEMTFESAVKDLADLKYEVREGATNFLWETSSYMELESYQTVDNPEVRYRINRILTNMKSGIRPDTSDKIKNLVYEFHESEVNRKGSILDELFSLSAFEQVFSLQAHLDNEEEKEILSRKVNRFVRKAVEYYLDGDDLERAFLILDLAEPSSHNTRLWAALIQIYKTPEEAYAELERGGVSPELISGRFLALARAQGEMAKAEGAAVERGQVSFLASRDLLAGDYPSYLDWWTSKYESLSLSEEFTRALNARAEGGLKPLDDYLISSQELVESGGLSKSRAVLQLVALGDYERAFQLMDRSEQILASEYLFKRGRFRELFDLYGFPLDKQGLDEWIKENIDSEEGEWWFDSSMAQLDTLGQALVYLNDKESIRKLLAPLWADLQDLPVDKTEFISQLMAQGYFEQALELSIEFLGEDEKKIKEFFLNGSEMQTYLWELSKGHLPELSLSDRIFLVINLSGGKVVGEELFKRCLRMLKLVEEDVLAHPEDEVRESYLVVIYKVLGEKEKLLSFYEQQHEEEKNWGTQSQLAIQYAFFDKWEKTAEIAEVIDNTGQVNAFLLELYRAGVLAKVGKGEKARLIMQGQRRYILDDPQSLYASAGIMKDLKMMDLAYDYFLKGVTVSSPDEYNGQVWANLMERGQELYHQKGEYKKAAVCGEARLLYLLRKEYRSRNILLGASGANTLSMIADIRFQTDFMWAKHYLTNGGNPALGKELLRRLAMSWKGHGVLADEVFPYMREIGDMELLESTYRESAKIHKEVLTHFSHATDVKNTFSWLASRARQDLDEALLFAKEAITAEPLSAAYLDTTAEVYFASGDRESALEYSERAWKNSQLYDNGKVIKEQYYYFKNAPLPVNNN